MGRSLIVEKLNFAIKYEKPVKIHSKKGKEFWADIYAFDGSQIKWRSENKQNTEVGLMLMNIDNINNLDFNRADYKEFCKYIKCKNNGIKDYKTLEENLQNLFAYYKLILNNEIENLNLIKSPTGEQKVELASLESKVKLLDVILEKLLESEDNLLFPFLTGVEFNNSIIDAADRPILLFSNSNASQKTAIERALTEKVSFIEGPPGTGKTTTILSIVANLLYRNKKIVVVSKNNSAIDNIGEELDKLDLPKIYVRLGNSSYTTDLFKDILDDIKNYQEQVENFTHIEELNIAKFNSEYTYIREKELKLNELVKKKNELAEFKNQKRHIEKRKEAYSENFSGKLPFWIKFLKLSQLCNVIDKVSNKIEKYNDKPDINISNFDKIIAVLLWGIKSNDFFKQYLFLKWELETIYLSNKMLEIQEFIEDNDFGELKSEINDLYKKSYCQKSIKLFKTVLNKEYLKSHGDFDNLVKEIELFKTNYKDQLENNSYDSDFLKEKSRLIQMITDFFPLTLTTADSLPSNFYDYRNGKVKFDYVIMDEATQCDVISGLSALFYAKNCVISGDSKQLSAITGDNDLDIDDSNINENLKYFNNDFLNATKSVFCVEPTLLKEHYRCDYNIINYCN